MAMMSSEHCWPRKKHSGSLSHTSPKPSSQIRCEFCGDCGTFLQLLKLATCCFRCLANDLRLLSVPMSFVRTVMGIDPKHLPQIPHLWTIPRAKFLRVQEHVP